MVAASSFHAADISSLEAGGHLGLHVMDKSSAAERPSSPTCFSVTTNSSNEQGQKELESSLTDPGKEKKYGGDEEMNDEFPRGMKVSYSATTISSLPCIPRISDLDATVSIKMLSASKPGISDHELEERNRICKFFSGSRFSFPHPDSDFPTFFHKEIVEGKILGAGGFSNVSEVVHIQLLRRSIDGKACTEQAELKCAHDDSGPKNKGSRAFMAEHCFRETTGEARYAVKRLLPETVSDKSRLYSGLADLVIETRFLYHLEHPNIVKIRGIATFDPFSKDFFIVMDRLYDTLLVRLKQWGIRKKKANSLFSRFICGRAEANCRALLGEQLKAAYDLSGALAYLHNECRVCHRDIKPENIGFDVRGDIKLFDFGLARDLSALTPDQDGLFHLSAMTGSFRYMSPCVALCKKYNELCDVYSFSLVLWSMLALKQPFASIKDRSEFMDTVFSQRQRPPLPDQWSTPLKEMFRQGWHHEASERCDVSTIRVVLKRELANVFAVVDIDNESTRRRSTYVYQSANERNVEGLIDVISTRG